MGFFKKARTFVTGESESERRYRKAAEYEISKREKAAYYRAKEKEAIKYAGERARIEREHRTKKLRQDYNKPSGFKALGSALGSIGQGIDYKSISSGIGTWGGVGQGKKKKSSNMFDLNFDIGI